MSAEMFINIVLLLLLVILGFWQIYENWWEIKKKLPSFWYEIKNGWRRRGWKFYFALIASPVCYFSSSFFINSPEILMKIFGGIEMLFCIFLVIYTLFMESKFDSLKKNRKLIEQGYGFLLDKEERDEVLKDGDIEVFKQLQNPEIIKRSDDYPS